MELIQDIQDMTDELRNLVRLVKQGRGNISHETFRGLVDECYRILSESEEQVSVSDEEFDAMLPFLTGKIRNKTTWKMLMRARTELVQAEIDAVFPTNSTAAYVLKIMLPLIRIPDELLNDEIFSMAGLLEERDCMVLKSQVSKTKLGSSDSSLNKCVTLSMTTLPLCIEATQDGKDMATYMTKYFHGNLEGSLLEGKYHSQMIGLPSNMQSLGPQKEAKTVFPLLYSLPRLVTPAPDGQPELGLRVIPEDVHTGTPPATLEWKTFDEAGIEELLQASTGALQDSYFRQPGQSWKFYAKPPYGIGTLYCGPSATAVFCYEMVGRLMFSLYDSGHSLGTQKHQQVYDCIESTIRQGERAVALDLSEHVRHFEVCDTVGRKVRYTKESVDGKFYKILRHDRFNKLGPKPWRDLYNVYKQLGEINPLPESLLQAILYYGEYQVAIELPFCEDATHCELNLTDRQKAGLRDAIVALGKVGLCYTDFRRPNLLVVAGDDSLRLIDYDDMLPYQDEDRVKEAYRNMPPIMFDGTTNWDDVQTVVQEYAAQG